MKKWCFKTGRQKGTSVIMYSISLMHFSSLFYSSILSYAYMSGSTCEGLQRYWRPCLYIMYFEQYGSIIHYRPLSILPTGHNATVNRLGLLSYIFPFGKFFFFFNWCRTSPKQGTLDPFLGSKLRNHIPTHQSRVSSISKELLGKIEPKMLGSIAHPKLPTT